MPTATQSFVWKKRYPVDQASPFTAVLNLKTGCHPLGDALGFTFRIEATYNNNDAGSYQTCCHATAKAQHNTTTGNLLVTDSDFLPDKYGSASSSLNITFTTDGSFTVVNVVVTSAAPTGLKGQLWITVTGGPDPTP